MRARAIPIKALAKSRDAAPSLQDLGFPALAAPGTAPAAAHREGKGLETASAPPTHLSAVRRRPRGLGTRVPLSGPRDPLESWAVASWTLDSGLAAPARHVTGGRGRGQASCDHPRAPTDDAAGARGAFQALEKRAEERTWGLGVQRPSG